MRLITDSYQVHVNDDVDGEYARKLAVVTPGFSVHVGNAFRYTENGGRKLDLGRPLYWGRGYYLVWVESLRATWPKAVWWEELRTHGGWKCARIELPSEADDNVERWADEFLGREIELPPVTLSLVSPASAKRLEDDSIIVGSESEVVVGVTGERGSVMPDHMNLVTAATRDPRVFQLPPRFPLTVLIGQLPVGSATLDLDDDETQLSLTVASEVATPVPKAPVLRFDNGSKPTELPIHSIAAARAMLQVREGGLEIVGLSLPERAGARLRTLPTTKVDATEVIFSWNMDEQAAAPANYSRGFEQQVLAALVRVVRSTKAVDVDFGNFGFIRLPKSGATKMDPVRIGLSESLRRRIRWLTILPTVAGSDQRAVQVPELKEAAGTILQMVTISNVDDRAMLAQLNERSSWSPAVVPQLRELATDLCSLLRSQA